jgi:hypothetical protein
MWFQAKKITKEGDRRKNAEKGFTEMYKHKKMKNPIRGKMVQRYIKEVKETMKKGRS